MAQHTYSIANQGGASFRADLNNALAAAVSNNSGTAAPSPTFAYMFWPDATSGWMKMRNAANSAWIKLWRLSDMAIDDDTFVLVDGTDVTKKLILQLSGITAGQTRTLTAPDANITLAGTDLAQNFTLPQRSGQLADNDLSFDISAKLNFVCTPTGAGTLTFTGIATQGGQSGFVELVNGSNYAIAAHANTKIAAADLAKISTTGRYYLDYRCNGTDVCVTVGGPF
ncbi:MAG: hypothetical protein Q7U97_06710 [Rhodocyclaceae bacterium]|nr:hypothetical protein [Rhodocyclaceae bacterium]